MAAEGLGRSVAGEARNSALGQIKNAQRSRMKHATSDRLVYLHESFHLMQRMQNAGWSADVERWESDCDSLIGRLLLSERHRMVYVVSTLEQLIADFVLL